MATVSADKLRKLVDRALDDASYAERVFREPEVVAKEAGLSDAETLVVKQMNAEQFEIARRDAAKTATSGEITERDLAGVVGGATLSVTSTTTNMILGRSLISATGGSYSNLSAAGCGCCPWSGSVSTGMLTLPAGP